MIAQGHGVGHQGKKNGLLRVKRKFLRVIDVFISLTVAVVLWIPECQEAAISTS